VEIKAEEIKAEEVKAEEDIEEEAEVITIMGGVREPRIVGDPPVNTDRNRIGIPRNGGDLRGTNIFEERKIVRRDGGKSGKSMAIQADLA
jgi:hypothetical protein